MIEAEVGAPIRINTKMDLTGATNPKIVATYKGGRREFSAQIEDSTYLVYYTTSENDLPVGSAGTWTIQGVFDLGGATGVGTLSKTFQLGKRI